MRFTNKVVIVTGAAGGIGLATAKRFASENACVVLADLSQTALEEARLQLTQSGARNIIIKICDVSREEQVNETVSETLERFKRLDTIVNNAGLMTFKPIEQLTGEDWTRILNVDLIGAFYFTKQAFLHMTKGGSIVNVCSIHAVETEPLVSSYAAAKAALLSFTRSAALEGAPKKIRVNAVLPGAVDTPMLWNNPNVRAGVEKINKADVGKPEDIAATIAFLASDEAKFVQGAALRVDGGRLDRL